MTRACRARYKFAAGPREVLRVLVKSLLFRQEDSLRPASRNKEHRFRSAVNCKIGGVLSRKNYFICILYVFLTMNKIIKEI